MLDLCGDYFGDCVVRHPYHIIINLDIDVARLQLGPCITVSLIFRLFLQELLIPGTICQELVKILEVLLIIGVPDPVYFVEPASVVDKISHQKAIQYLTPISPSVEDHRNDSQPGRFDQLLLYSSMVWST